MAANDKASAKAQPAGNTGAVEKDFASNPIGTTYSENGTAQPEGMGLVNLPQPAAPAPQVMYNEDGSIFAPPADADKRILELKAEITGLGIAITKGNDKVKTATEMMAEADAEDKPIFEKNINSQKVAIESNTAVKVAKEQELEDFRLSLVTPAQRATERQLAAKVKQRDALNEEIKILENTKKAWNIEKGATPKGTTTATGDKPLSSDEQKANHAALVLEHGTQGKAVIHLVKQGWKNNAIAKHMGIPDASVPGPKNAWKESPEGVEFMKLNPGVVQ